MDIHIFFAYLLINIKNLIDKHFPIMKQKKDSRQLKNPWIDKDLIKLINKKDKIYKLYKQGKTNFNFFKKYRNLLNKTIAVAKKCYYIEHFKEAESSPKESWKRMNKILKPYKATKFELKLRNMLINEPKELSNEFNKHFRMPEIPNISHPANPNITPNEKSFYFFKVEPYEIAKIIMKLKNNNKNTSEIPIVLLKFIVTDLAEVLAPAFDLCFSRGIFPDCLKYSEIIPIPKKGSSKLINNYRPISLLHPITKIFEKLLYLRILSFFNKHSLITDLQFGFRKGKDISQAASNLLYFINESNRKNEISTATFIDFSKAFDSIDRQMLLNKLSLYGIRGLPLQFFTSYFTNRYQLTKINNIKSDVLPNSIGVPQGSALGPLFFSIFINDVVKCIKNSVILLYADDLVIINTNKDEATVSSQSNADLARIFNWSATNKLNINFSKTKTMTFTRKRNINIPIYLNNNLIEKVTEFKYLGLLIDQDLSFKNHILNLVKKVNQANRCIYLLKRYLPLHIMRRIYFSTINPHLVQHLISWGGANASNLYPLKIALNKVIRNLCSRDISTSERFKFLEILNLEQLYKLRLAETMYKIIILKESPLLINIINEIEWKHKYNTRRKNEFKLPLLQTEANRVFFLSNAIKLWATLPDEMKLSCTLMSLKNKYKKYLLFNL